MRKFRNFVAAALTGGIIAFPSPASAVEPMTVAAVAAGLSQVVSMFDKGANPGAVQVAQSHQMLTLMHDRLGSFTKAFERVYEKIGDYVGKCRSPRDSFGTLV